MPERITLNQNTSLEQLKQFTDKLGDNAKIRGKQNDDGSVTLYTSNKRNLGIKEFFTNHVTRRQDNAKQGLNDLFDRLSQKPGLDNKAKEMLTSLKQPFGSGEMRGGALKELVAKSRLELNFSGMLSEGLRDNDETKLSQCRDLMSERLSEKMRAMTPEQQMRLAASDGKQVLDQIVGRIHDRIGDNDGPIQKTYDQCGPEMKKFLDDVYNQSTLNLKDKVIDNETFQRGDVTYKLDKHVTDSGFGSIDLYKRQDGLEDKENPQYLVLKTPLGLPEEMPDKFDEASTECLSHLKAQSGGTDSVINLKSAMRLPGGGLVLALEYAPNRDGWKVMNSLQRIGNEKINEEKVLDDKSSKIVYTTMLKDMLESLKDVQDNGLIHRDVKPPNYLVDEGGKLKLMDFGTARVGESFSYGKDEGIDNPLWCAPEAFLPFVTLSNKIDDLNRLEALAKKEINKEIPNEDERKVALKNISKDYSTQRTQLKENTIAQVTNKVDTWSVGITAFQMYTGKESVFEGKSSDVEIQLKNFQSNPNSRLLEKNEGIDSFDGKFIDLINGLTHPDPEKRMSPEQALNSEIFNAPGVGSNEVRSLLTNPLLHKEQLTDDEKELLRQEGAKING